MGTSADSKLSIHRVTALPANLDLATASANQLRAHGLPPRPAETDPGYTLWKSIWTRRPNFVDPVFRPLTVRGRLDPLKASARAHSKPARPKVELSDFVSEGFGGSFVIPPTDSVQQVFGMWNCPRTTSPTDDIEHFGAITISTLGGDVPDLNMGTFHESFHFDGGGADFIGLIWFFGGSEIQYVSNLGVQPGHLLYSWIVVWSPTRASLIWTNASTNQYTSVEINQNVGTGAAYWAVDRLVSNGRFGPLPDFGVVGFQGVAAYGPLGGDTVGNLQARQGVLVDMVNSTNELLVSAQTNVFGAVVCQYIKSS